MAVFTPAEEVERISAAPRELAEKAEKDFFREEWVVEPGILMLTEDLAVAGVLMEAEEVEAAEEGTLVEAVGTVKMTPVEEGEDLIVAERIRKTNVASTEMAMVM